MTSSLAGVRMLGAAASAAERSALQILLLLDTQALAGVSVGSSLPAADPAAAAAQPHQTQ